MLVTMGMIGTLTGPSSYFDLSGVFDSPTWIYAKFTVRCSEENARLGRLSHV